MNSGHREITNLLSFYVAWYHIKFVNTVFGQNRTSESWISISKNIDFSMQDKHVSSIWCNSSKKLWTWKIFINLLRIVRKFSVEWKLTEFTTSIDTLAISEKKPVRTDSLSRSCVLLFVEHLSHCPYSSL